MAFHAQLPFTSDDGRFQALASTLETNGFPDIVCLQEAGEPTTLVAKLPANVADRYTFFAATCAASSNRITRPLTCGLL